MFHIHERTNIVAIRDFLISGDKYFDVFNIRDGAKDAPKGSTAPVPVGLADFAFADSARIRDFREKKKLPAAADFASEVPFHGAAFSASGSTN